MKYLTLLLLAACAHGSVPPMSKIGDVNTKMVVAADMIINNAQWRNSGYARESEDGAMSFPIFLVVAADNTACIVDGMTWGSWYIKGHPVKCLGRWRIKRP